VATGFSQVLVKCRCWQSVVVAILSCLNCFWPKLSSALHLLGIVCCQSIENFADAAVLSYPTSFSPKNQQNTKKNKHL
jgi:hypothetical protein